MKYIIIFKDGLAKFKDGLAKLWRNKITLCLMYLIPIINIIFIISNVGKLTDILVKTCTVFSSTAAASACTIKGIKKEENDRLNNLQVFALVLSIVSFMCCLIHEISSITYINIYIVIFLTTLANILAIKMYIIANDQIQDLQYAAYAMVKNKEHTSTGSSEFNIKVKEEK